MGEGDREWQDNTNIIRHITFIHFQNFNKNTIRMNFIYFSIIFFSGQKETPEKETRRRKWWQAKSVEAIDQQNLNILLYSSIWQQNRVKKKFSISFSWTSWRKKNFYIVRLLQISKGGRARRSRIKKIKEKHRKKWLK